MGYEFQETREEVIVTMIEGEYEEKTLVIESSVKGKDIVFEDCNIIFDLSKGAAISGNKIRLVDCEILFIGSNEEPVIKAEKSNIEIEGCTFIQQKAKKDVMNTYIYSEGESRVDLSDSVFSGLQGTFIISEGSSVYIENCEVNGYIGKFCEVTYYKSTTPSVKVTNSKFKKFKRMAGGYGNEGYIFDVNEFIKCTFDNLEFNSCDMGCIKVEGQGDCTINGCTFKKCPSKASGLNLGYEPFNIYAYCETSVLSCKFIQSRGVYFHPQYKRLLVKKCVFDRCSTEESFRDGILHIMNEVDEQCINIENCKFKKCVVNGQFDESETGIIYIVAGVPEKCQEGSVLIKKCSFDDCEADEDIWGKERQDGFFGKTITFYREV